MDWFIVGLGNPGSRYSSTRHNAGFRVVDHVVSKLAAAGAVAGSSTTKADCEYLKVALGSDTFWLIKPLAFMNLSGQSLQSFFHFFKIKPPQENFMVVYDDLDFDPGVVRLRDSGSAGGHNGVSDIINSLNRDDFVRVRVGIGHPRRTTDRQNIPVEKWVLSAADGEEGRLLAEAEQSAASLVMRIVKEGFSKAKAAN